jgi:hypothetical protein
VSVTKTLTPQQILALPIEACPHTEATTVGKYLIRVLAEYYTKNWEFNVTAPLGKEAWKVPIRDAFRKAGLIHPDDYDTDLHIKQAFDLLSNADYTTLKKWEPPKDWYVVLLEVDAYGDVLLEDSTNEGYTEEEAKRVAKECNGGNDGTGYIAIRMPK